MSMMLSPHEIAALMVLGGSARDRELDPADIGTLVERQLVRLASSAPGSERMHVTGDGHRFLQAIGRSCQAPVAARHHPTLAT
ncbi:MULTISPECIES: hypothetical protein [Cupriavidus]